MIFYFVDYLLIANSKASREIRYIYTPSETEERQLLETVELSLNPRNKSTKRTKISGSQSSQSLIIMLKYLKVQDTATLSTTYEQRLSILLLSGHRCFFFLVSFFFFKFLHCTQIMKFSLSFRQIL